MNRYILSGQNTNMTRQTFTSWKQRTTFKKICYADIFAAHVDVFSQGYAKIYEYNFCHGQYLNTLLNRDNANSHGIECDKCGRMCTHQVMKTQNIAEAFWLTLL